MTQFPHPMTFTPEEIEALCKRLDMKTVHVQGGMANYDHHIPDSDCLQASAIIRQLQEQLKAAETKGWNEAIEAAAKACQIQHDDFLSPQYATGQPLSSICERTACAACEEAIHQLKKPPEAT